MGARKVPRDTRLRSKTRSNKPKLLDGSDPLQEEKQLKAQLAKDGLYLANTLGDGNCLFRALSDQLTGNESSHALLRHQVCEYLDENADRYSPYVDSDAVPGGYRGHVASMRQLGTYGTDIELTAFSHLFKRPIRVFQPGLVYVIQAEDARSSSSASSTASTSKQTLEHSSDEDGQLPQDGDDSNLTPRDRRLRARKSRQEKKLGTTKRTSSDKTKGKSKLAATDEKRRKAAGALYIAYHSWEHYSSVRRILGPHTGPPHVEQVQDEPAEVELAESVAQPVDQGKPERQARPKRGLKLQRLASSIALPPSLDPSPASTPPPGHDSAPSDRPRSPKHRGRSLSISSSTSSQHARQRSRRETPASSSAPSPASSFETDAPDKSMLPLGVAQQQDDGADTEDTASSFDPIDLINPGRSERHAPPPQVKQVVIPTTKGTIARQARRGPTAREKKDLQRKRRMEARRSKVNGANAAAAAAARAGRSAGGRTAAVGESLAMDVRELFI